MNERKDMDMGNAINGLAGRSAMAAMDSAQDAAPPVATDQQVKTLYGTATQELQSMMNRLRQLPETAQALVSSRNPDLQ